MTQDAFEIGGLTIPPNSRQTVDLPVSVLSDHTPVNMSVHVVHGREPGPTLFVSAAVHGDEVMGVEVVRRLLRVPSLDTMKGTMLAVPIVNSYGFLSHSRYLPDRRDLNRSFPGDAVGSLAARLAHKFMTEIVGRSDVGIDLHSAAIHRTNLPQVRVSPRSAQALALAKVFGAPIVMSSQVREGSLRQAAQDQDVDILLFEAGEGLRFDEVAVRTGVLGILRVMRHLGMVKAKGIAKAKAAPMHSSSSFWLRAPVGGLLRTLKAIGAQVEQDDVLGLVSDPFGDFETEVVASEAGLLVGRTNLPVVNEGDGLFHVARIRPDDDPVETIDRLSGQLEEDPLFDEDEII